MKRKLTLSLETLFYVLLAGAAVYNHRGFLGYALQKNVLAGIPPLDLCVNILVVPSVLGLFAASFLAYGRRIISFFAGRETLGPYALAAYAAMGMGASNLFFYYAGAAGILYPLLVIAFLLAGSALAAWDFLRSQNEHRFTLPGSAVERAAFAVTALAVCYNLLAALSPPVSWDALAYHLPVPKYYALAHRVIEIPFMTFKQASIGGEMLTAAGLLVSGDTLPQLFSLFAEILMLRLIYVFGSRHFSTEAGWVSCALFAAAPAVARLGWIVNSDMNTALYAAMAAGAFIEYAASKKDGWLYVSAAFLGLAAAAKMNALFAAGCAVIACASLAVSGKLKPSTDKILAAILIFLFLAAPPYAQRYLWTGNPFFPYLTGLFGAGSAAAAGVLAKLETELAATVGIPATFTSLLAAPYHLIAHNARFQDAPALITGSWLAVFLLRLSARRRFTALETGLGAYSAAYFVFWFFFGRVWRLMLPVMPFILMLAAGWAAREENRFRRALMLAALAANLLVFASWSVNNQLFGTFALPSLEDPGKPPRDKYLEKALDHYAVYDYANRNLPADSVVFLFREIRGYYLDRPYLWGDPLNQSMIVYGEFSSPAALAGRLKALGVTHVIVNFNSYGPDELYYTPATLRLVHGAVNRYFTKLYRANGVILYGPKKAGNKGAK